VTENTNTPLIQQARQLLREGYARQALALLPAAASPLEPVVEQTRAHALANTGAPGRARAVLQALIDQGNRDIETLGFLGRIEKDLARTAQDTTRANQHWQAALGYYREAFASSGDPYPGINAATLLLRLGQQSAAHQMAQQVINACDAGLSQNPDQAYWELATLAEANLVLGNHTQARDYYARAVHQHQSNFSALGSMARQAMELLMIAQQPQDLLQDILILPKVAVFAGHMIDSPKRISPRFNVADLPACSAALERLIREQNIGSAYTGLANGSDILFAEAIIDAGAQLHAVLPMDVNAFEDFSVRSDLIEAKHWSERYRRLLDQAKSVTVASDGLATAGTADLRYCNAVALGLAQLSARELATQVIGVALWDGQVAQPGGTADSVALWQRAKLDIHVLSTQGQPQQQHPKVEVQPNLEGRNIMALVFADVVNYSKLSETDIGQYYDELLPKVAELVAAGHPPAVQQTFGDAFYFAFHELADAATLALALQSLFRNPAQLPSLSQPLRIRIALHAGPLMSCQDPINRTTNYTGRHTSKAARVEPVVPENQILTTQQFAALAANLAHHPYEFSYVGEQALAKNYGTERLYLLTPNDTALH